MAWVVDWPVVLQAAVAAGAAAWFFAKLATAHYFNKSIEAHRAKLAAGHAVELERLRADLRVEAHAHEIRTAEMLKRRAVVVAETYRLLVEVEISLQVLMDQFAPPGDRTSVANAAMEAGIAFNKYATGNLIILPAEVSVQVTEIVDLLRRTFLGFVSGGSSWNQLSKPGAQERQDKAYRALISEVPAKKAALEAAFRALVAAG